MSEETLKPCPFCGGEIEKTQDGITHKCPQGKAPTLTIHTPRIKDFAKVWNSRPIEDALRKRVEELEAALNDIQCLSPAVAYTSFDSKVIELDYSDYCDYFQKIKELTEVALKKKAGE